MLTRRSFVGVLAGLSAGILPSFGAEKERGSEMTDKKREKEEEVTPTEDLMREHGALNRMLLLYENAHDTLNRKEQFPREVVLTTATLVRKFIEEYHEKLEENHLFPRFQKAGTLTELVQVLKSQHDAGKKLTGTILTISGSDAAFASGHEQLVESLARFIRMYRPHEAREDTVLFPAFRSLVSEKEYKSLGEQFEEQEHKLFGEDGFKTIVEQIADLEKKVGIYELKQFTP